MGLDGPALVGSHTSGVDGSSEGGRLSTNRLPATLVLYSVPLVEELKRAGYPGKLSAEPALVDGGLVLRVTYDGDKPKAVPQRWHGHRVVLERAKPAGG
jgi:hypothetical protein